MSVLSEISGAMQRGKAKLVRELVARGLEEGRSAGELLEGGLMAGMDAVGARFQRNEIFVPEVLIAARAMNAGMELLRPEFSGRGPQMPGRVCIGTVKGDLHDIGKNLVRMMMESKGLQVVDLGVEVEAETFVRAAVEQDCGIIACSALLTTTMPVMGEVVRLAREAGIRGRVKIMVGGAPVTGQFCQSIGADCYTADAVSAAEAAAGMLG